MVCEGARRPVTSRARSQVVGRRSDCINKYFQKQRPVSSGGCLKTKSRAQARDALSPSFIRRESQWRARTLYLEFRISPPRNSVVLKSEGECRGLVVGRDISRKALSVGDNGCDAQGCGCLHATSEWMSGSSLVKRERPIGPRERRGRIGGPESLKPWPSLPTLYHLTFSFTATSSNHFVGLQSRVLCSPAYMDYLDYCRKLYFADQITCSASFNRKTTLNVNQLHNTCFASLRNRMWLGV